MRMRKFLAFFVTFQFISISLSNRNLLLFAPAYGGSHTIFHKRLGDALAKAGYNVLSFEPEVYVDPAEFEGSQLVERFIVPRQNRTDSSEDNKENGENYKDVFERTFATDSVLNMEKMFKSYLEKIPPICEDWISRKNVMDRLRGYKFDAIVYEPFILCGTGFAHLLGIKTQIFVSSMPLIEYTADLMGVPIPSSHLPSILMPIDFSDQKIGYFDRIWNIFAIHTLVTLMKEMNSAYDEIFKKHFGANFPDLDALAREAELCFLIADKLLDYPRPLQANVVALGPFGLDPRPNTTFSAPFGVEMQKGQQGIVLVSLGTHVSTAKVPIAFMENLLRPMNAHQGLHFIMKVDKQDVESMRQVANSMGVKNVFITGWLPQSQLLAHPRVRLFISHAGFNSLNEAAYYGVPIIGIPFFADQIRNANLAVRNGWGLKVVRQSLLHDNSELSDAIHEILNNPTYKEKAMRTQNLIRNKPGGSGEELLKAYLDLLFEKADGHLPEWKSAARHMPAWQYNNLDIFLPALIIAQIILYFLTKLIISLCQKLINRS